MDFKGAYEAMKQGARVKLPEWAGFWGWEGNTIKMHCKDGRILDIRETEDVGYTLKFIMRDDWEVASKVDVKDLNIQTFTFGEATRRLKAGQKVTRKGWNGKGLFVVYQKAYPQGIPCNRQTAEAWGMEEGELFRCEPYFQINTAGCSHAMWVPSITDCLADDWEEVQ